MTAVLMLAALLGNAPFVVDASGGTEYSVDVPRAVLREYVDDIGLFERNMPGVVGIEPLGDGVYLYHTRKDIPLSTPMETTFRIRRVVESDSLTWYRSVDPEDQNYMACAVRVRPAGPSRTTIGIRLEIRLAREEPSDVHWLAPIVGEGFISDRMEEDIASMLEEFVRNSTAELHARYLTPGGEDRSAR